MQSRCLVMRRVEGRIDVRRRSMEREEDELSTNGSGDEMDTAFHQPLMGGHALPVQPGKIPFIPRNTHDETPTNDLEDDRFTGWTALNYLKQKYSTKIQCPQAAGSGCDVIHGMDLCETFAFTVTAKIDAYIWITVDGSLSPLPGMYIHIIPHFGHMLTYTKFVNIYHTISRIKAA